MGQPPVPNNSVNNNVNNNVTFIDETVVLKNDQIIEDDITITSKVLDKF